MRKLVSLLAAVAMTLVISAPVFAISPSEQECLDAGGTWDRTQGTVSCTFETSDPVGNSENSGGKSQTVDSEETESSNGTLNNKPKHQESSECTGPGNGGSTAQCP
jgi:hypothetical protein